MLDNISVLLVLVVWAGCLDHTLNSVDRAWDPVAGNEFRKISGIKSIGNTVDKTGNEPVKKLNGDTKVRRHSLQAHHSVAL